TDDAVDHESCALLKLLYGGFCVRPERAIKGHAEIWGSPQCALKPADCVAARARSDRRLSRIWHVHLLLEDIGQAGSTVSYHLTKSTDGALDLSACSSAFR